jgi:antirestriction protein ArdC
MPVFEASDADSYWRNSAHEFTHWTGNKSRFDRDFPAVIVRERRLRTEELVAELGAAFLC